MEKEFVGIFFYCKNELVLFDLNLKDAENYGEFRIYPYSHDEIWEKYLRVKYKRDYDYYPRGRIMFNKKEKCFWIYSDQCIPLREIEKMGSMLGEFIMLKDEHYVCHQCSSYLE